MNFHRINDSLLSEKIIKLILIGDKYVGKTTIRKKYLGENHTAEYLSTIGADFSVKRITS